MKKPVIVSDKMQKNYKYYLTEPEGKNFSPVFKPQLTPREMLELGIFGGKYMTDCRREFPADWFRKAKLSPGRKDPKINFFRVDASLALRDWQSKGWIHPDDPRGWFQWYCRYYRGRRHQDDARQIQRWKNMARHTAAIRNNCLTGDWNCRPRQRQAVLHWAYDSRVL